jgi:hypothetical protein
VERDVPRARIRILAVAGARPNFLKIAPLLRGLGGTHGETMAEVCPISGTAARPSASSMCWSAWPDGLRAR